MRKKLSKIEEMKKDEILKILFNYIPKDKCAVFV